MYNLQLHSLIKILGTSAQNKMEMAIIPQTVLHKPLGDITVVLSIPEYTVYGMTPQYAIIKVQVFLSKPLLLVYNSSIHPSIVSLIECLVAVAAG